MRGKMRDTYVYTLGTKFPALHYYYTALGVIDLNLD